MIRGKRGRERLGWYTEHQPDEPGRKHRMGSLDKSGLLKLAQSIGNERFRNIQLLKAFVGQ